MLDSHDFKENGSRTTTPRKSLLDFPLISSPLQPTTRNHSNLQKDTDQISTSSKMLEATVLKPLNSDASKERGKLLLDSSMDAVDLEVQLKKIQDTQSSLKTTISLMNSAVKQTQMDLGSLVQRSTNNNSHLKDLLQSVTTAAKKTTGITEETLQSVISQAFEEYQTDLFNDDKASVLQETLMTKLDLVYQDNKNQHEKIKSLISSKVEDSIENKSLMDFLSMLEKHNNQIQLAVSSLNHKLDQHTEELQHILKQTNESDYREILEHAMNNIKIQNTEIVKSISNLDTVLKENSNESSSSIEDVKAILFSLENASMLQDKTISGILSSDTHLNFMNDLKDHLFLELKSIQKNLDQSFTNFDTSLSALKTDPSLETILQSHTKSIINKVSEQNETYVEQHTSGLLREKEMEIKLKDQEISDLRKQLQEQEEKFQTNQTIKELTEKKVVIKMKMEALNQAYSKRYEEFKQLSSDHQALSCKISNINRDKLASVLNSVSLTTHNNSENKTKVTTRTNNQRIFSTNSYLQKNPAVSSTNTKKSYFLAETDQVKGLDEYDVSF